MNWIPFSILAHHATVATMTAQRCKTKHVLHSMSYHSGCRLLVAVAGCGWMADAPLTYLACILTQLCIQGFYAVYSTVFQKLAEEERQAAAQQSDQEGSTSPPSLPAFGMSSLVLSFWPWQLAARRAILLLHMPIVACNLHAFCSLPSSWSHPGTRLLLEKQL